MWVVEYIKSEWTVLKAAPVAFLGFLIAGLVLGYLGGSTLRSQEVANLESLIRLKDGELDEYRKKIEQRLDNVEKQLSAQQISALEEALKQAKQPSRIELKGGEQGKIENQLKDTFEKSGWFVQPLPSDEPDGPGTIRTEDKGAAKSTDKALKDAGVNYTVSTPPGTSATDFMLNQM